MIGALAVFITLTVVFGVVMFLLVGALVYVFFILRVVVNGTSYSLTQLIHKPVDIESGVSLAGLKSRPLSLAWPTNTGDIFVRVSPSAHDIILESLQEFHDATSNTKVDIDHIPEELDQVAPDSCSFEGIDSLSKTLMIQLYFAGLDNKIFKVSDVYSQNMIQIGLIIVVVKPYLSPPCYLQPGDLLRVIGFTVKPPKQKLKKFNILKGSDVEEHAKTAAEVTSIYSDDPEYPDVYCTGILLSTYLDFVDNSCHLERKPEVDQNLIMEFPINIVSSETSVLNGLEDYSPRL